MSVILLTDRQTDRQIEWSHNVRLVGRVTTVLTNSPVGEVRPDGRPVMQWPKWTREAPQLLIKLTFWTKSGWWGYLPWICHWPQCDTERGNQRIELCGKAISTKQTWTAFEVQSEKNTDGSTEHSSMGQHSLWCMQQDLNHIIIISTQIYVRYKTKVHNFKELISDKLWHFWLVQKVK